MKARLEFSCNAINGVNLESRLVRSLECHSLGLVIYVSIEPTDL